MRISQLKPLSDSGNEVNVTTPTYTAKWGLVTQKTDIEAQKIDGSTLVTDGMVLAGFSVPNKLGKVWFFEETFMLADISMEVVLEMPFLTFYNTDMKFLKKELEWRSYTTIEALPTTKRVELIDKMEFVAMALNKNAETFVVHIATLSAASAMQIHSSR